MPVIGSNVELSDELEDWNCFELNVGLEETVGRSVIGSSASLRPMDFWEGISYDPYAFNELFDDRDDSGMRTTRTFMASCLAKRVNLSCAAIIASIG
jgi:hypothetical protein